jgi:hypothetical protein
MINAKVIVQGTVEEGIFGDTKLAPTQKQYITKLTKVVTKKNIDSLPTETPKPIKKKEKYNDWW